MAGGALVPHTLPDGRTIMVPDYLAPKPGSLSMPAAPKPQAPDMRLAANSATDLGGAPDPALIGDWNKDAQQQKSVSDIRAALAPKAEPTNTHAAPKSRIDELSSIGNKPAGTKGGGVDPSTLATGGPRSQQSQQQGEGDGMNPLVRRVFNEWLRRGGGGPARPAGEVVASRKIEREPGKELLPEYKWAMGLEARPDFGQVVDEDAQREMNKIWPRSTIGEADNGPAPMRNAETGIERGMRASGSAARSEFWRQERERQEFDVAQRQQLVQQSQLVDEQLNTIAERRNRIAKLQENAEKRMKEAESFEPRTREQVWQDKGGLAQAMGVVAMAIGGYVQGLGRSGGRNPGWDMINKVLDDAVEGDRQKSERRRKVGLDAKSDYEKALAIYGDVDMAALDAKNRKLASVMALTKQQLASKGLDATAKMRGEEVYAAAQQQFLANQQQLFDQIAGKVTKEEINFKPGMAGGGGGGNDTLSALEKAARAKKAVDTIEGTGGAPDLKASDLKDVNQSDASLASVDKMLKAYPDDGEIPGLADPNVVSRGARGVLDWAGGAGTGSRVLDSAEERRNKQNTENLVAGVIQSISGAGVSNEERQRLTDMVRGARTKGDLQNIINIVRTKNSEFRRLAGGGQATAPSQRADSERPVD